MSNWRQQRGHSKLAYHVLPSLCIHLPSPVESVGIRRTPPSSEGHNAKLLCYVKAVLQGALPVSQI